MTEENVQVLPNHVGFILDGNRRWAKAHGLPPLKGHEEGYGTLKKVLEHALERWKVGYVSVFVFSTENWSRTKEEVKYLMDLALKAMLQDLKELHEKNIRVAWIGSEEGVSEKLRKEIRKAEELTANNTGGTLGLCFNYGGQREITDSVREIVRQGVKPEEITEELISKHLYAPEVPPIDLLIRTSGEQRLSNFMLWRAAYSELVFVDKYWPDFTDEDLDRAIDEYAARNRRFGG